MVEGPYKRASIATNTTNDHPNYFLCVEKMNCASTETKNSGYDNSTPPTNPNVIKTKKNIKMEMEIHSRIDSTN